MEAGTSSRLIFPVLTWRPVEPIIPMCSTRKCALVVKKGKIRAKEIPVVAWWPPRKTDTGINLEWSAGAMAVELMEFLVYTLEWAVSLNGFKRI